jgi:hypothetical protein
VSLIQKTEVTNIVYVQPLNIDPGDTIIVTCEKRISRDVFNKLKSQLQEQTGCKVIVLETGLKLTGKIEGQVR